MTTSLILKITEDGAHDVRGMLAANDNEVFSVYDFMTKACKYGNTGASARNEFKRLTKEGSEFKDEVVASCYSLRFPGQRGPATPCMTIRGLQRLLMILGGKVAAEFRALVEGVFTRVMAGDQSLIEVINANAASDAPINKMYRRALAAQEEEAGQGGMAGAAPAGPGDKRSRADMSVDAAEMMEAATTQLVQYKHVCEETLVVVQKIKAARQELSEIDPATLKAMETVRGYSEVAVGVRDTNAAVEEMHEINARNAVRLRKDKELDAAVDADTDMVRATGKANAAEYLQTRMRQLEAAAAAAAAPPPAPPAVVPRQPQPMMPEQQQPKLITIRSVANQAGLLIDTPAQAREMALAEAGRRYAAAFRAAGGIERQVMEQQHLVLAYTDDEASRDEIIEMLQVVLEESGHLAGPITLNDFKWMVPKHVKKSREIARIMDNAERLVKEEIMKQPDGRLLAKRGNVQTFANEMRQLIMACVKRAIAAVTNGGIAASLDGWIRASAAH